MNGAPLIVPTILFILGLIAFIPELFGPETEHLDPPARPGAQSRDRARPHPAQDAGPGPA